MSAKGKIYKLFPFIPRTNLAIGQKIHSIKTKLNAGKIRKILSNQVGLYANIGCGDLGISENWVNLDNSKYKNVTFVFDCRKDLPFASNTVKGIFCEHFFEHLDYSDEVPYFLKSCYNGLEMGGVLRIIVPDAEKYLIGYCQEGWDYLIKTRPLDKNLNDKLMNIQYQTKMQLVNEVFRQSGQHKYAWDFETLKLALSAVGFSDISKMDYMKSKDPKLEIDQPIRMHESLYVDAIK